MKRLDRLAQTGFRLGLCSIFWVFSGITLPGATPPSPPEPEYILNRLEKAVEKGYVSEVKQALRLGLNIEGGRNDGLPLRLAIQKGDDEMVAFLLNQGANVNAAPDSLSPLHWAAKFNRNEKSINILKKLLEAGADVNHVYNNYYPNDRSRGTTPIFWATGNPEAVRVLIDAGADVNIKSVVSCSLLCQAVEDHNLESVDILIDSGIAVDTAELLLHTVALSHYEREYASYGMDFNDQKAMIERLLKLGFNINRQDRNGNTALHNAITRLWLQADTRIVKLLLANGADPGISAGNSHVGGNAAHLFASNINVFSRDSESFSIEVFELLIKYKVNINALTKSKRQTVLDILRENAVWQSKQYNENLDRFDTLPLIKYLKSQGANSSL